MAQINLADRTWPQAAPLMEATINRHEDALFGDGKESAGLVGENQQKRGQQRMLHVMAAFITLFLLACTAMLGLLTYNDQHRMALDQQSRQHHQSFNEEPEAARQTRPNDAGLPPGINP